MVARKKSSKSLLDYYVTAAIIAVKLDVGIEYAFRKYVKPHMPTDGGIQPFSLEQIEMMKQAGVFQ